MSYRPIDGTVTLRLTSNPARITVSIEKQSTHGSEFYLKAFQMESANTVDDKVIFITSNQLQLTNADSSLNMKAGNGVHLPVIGPNFFYEFNEPYKLRATTFPREIDFFVYNQAGNPASFIALTLYFEMKQ